MLLFYILIFFKYLYVWKHGGVGGGQMNLRYGTH